MHIFLCDATVRRRASSLNVKRYSLYIASSLLTSILGILAIVTLLHYILKWFKPLILNKSRFYKISISTPSVNVLPPVISADRFNLINRYILNTGMETVKVGFILCPNIHNNYPNGLHHLHSGKFELCFYKENKSVCISAILLLSYEEANH